MSKVSLAGNASGTGIFTIASPNSNTDRTVTLPDATGTVLLSGNPISGTTGSFATTIGVGGATPATTGAGITFPATPSLSSNANTLDDYEQGTYIPVVKNGSTTLTYSTDWTIRLSTSGNYIPYVKVGRLVQIGFTIEFNSNQTGRLQVSLPFAASNGDYSIGGALSWYSTSTSVTGTVGFLGNGTTTIDFFLVTDTGNHSNLAVTPSTEIYFNIAYYTAA